MSRFLLSKLVVIGIFFSAVSLFAQEDFSVPGLDAPKKAAPTAPAAGTTPGTVEVEDSSLWGMVKKGGWAMWPLGLLSVAAIALSIYFLMDFKAANFAPRELVSRLEGKLAEGDLAGAGDLARNSPACLAARGHFAVSGSPLRTAGGNLAPVLSVFFLAGNVQILPVNIFLYGPQQMLRQNMCSLFIAHGASSC